MLKIKSKLLATLEEEIPTIESQAYTYTQQAIALIDSRLYTRLYRRL